MIAQMPRFTHAATGINDARIDPDAPALPFEVFAYELLGWVDWWNTDHRARHRPARRALAVGVRHRCTKIDAATLWMFTLEDDRAHRKITTEGVGFGRGRHYVADWTVGMVYAARQLAADALDAHPTPDFTTLAEDLQPCQPGGHITARLHALHFGEGVDGPFRPPTHHARRTRAPVALPHRLAGSPAPATEGVRRRTLGSHRRTL